MIDPKRIWSSSQLPTLPTVAVRLLELTRDPETEIRDVIDAIKADPAISAKILKAANSTFFGFKSEVKAIDRAVPLLGTTVATSLALSFSLCDDAMIRGPIAEHYRQYWLQSVVQAAAAETIGQRVDPAAACEFFLCGLLQDLGRLAMLKTIPREYAPVLDEARETGRPLHEVETERLGFNHVEISAKLMENWKLPDVLVQAVRLHLTPVSELDAQRELPQFPLIVGMAVAACVAEYFCTDAKGRALERLRQLTASHFRLSDSELDAFLRQCSERIAQAGELFNADVADLGDPSDLMVQANEQLVQMTLREHAAKSEAAQRQREIEQEKLELESRNRELQQQALHDPLTRVYNRNFFNESIEKEVARCQRSAATIGVIFADIDHFKKLNDTYGHQFGDQVLQQVAKIFQGSIRTSDVLARFGGEEFVVLVNQPTEKGIEKLAERIRERIAEEVFQCGDQRVRVTCSLGAAVTIPGRKEQGIAEKLIAAADACLYEAKHAGRNQVRTASLVSELDRQLTQQVTNHRFSRWLVAQQLLDIPTASRALLECPVQNVRIGELAELYGYLTSQQVQTILEEQDQRGERFGAAALRLGWLTMPQLVHLLTLQQENPKQLAAALIRLGILPPEKATLALEQYLETQAPRPLALAGAIA